MWLHFFAFYVPLIKGVKIYERTHSSSVHASMKSCQAVWDNLVGFLRSSRDRTARACTLLPTEDNAFTLASYCEVAHLSASFLQSTAQFFFRRVFLSWANAPLACRWFYPRYYSYGKKKRKCVMSYCINNPTIVVPNEIFLYNSQVSWRRSWREDTNWWLSRMLIASRYRSFSHNVIVVFKWPKKKPKQAIMVDRIFLGELNSVFMQTFCFTNSVMAVCHVIESNLFRLLVHNVA